MNGHDLMNPCGLPSHLWPDNLTPIAFVIIDGLAICGFAPNKRCWNTFFYHESGHRLTLGNKDTGEIQLNTTAEEVRIYAGGQDPYQSFPKGSYTDPTISNEAFRRDDRNQSPSDFRWVIDIAKPRDVPGNARFRGNPNFGVTKTTIYNSVLFTCKLTPRKLYLVPDGIDPNYEGNIEDYEFGYANDTIVAVVFGDDSRVQMEIIRDDGYSEQLRLPRSDTPHMINLMNMRPEHHVVLEHESAPDPGGRFAQAKPRMQWLKGDFQLYYEAVVSQKKFCLWGDPGKGDRIDCDSITLGDGS